MVGTRDIAGRRRGRHRTGWGTGVVALLVLSACGEGNEPDTEAGLPHDFEATPAYLAMVTDQTTDEAYRYESWMVLGDGEPNGPAPITGAEDGAAAEVHVDFQDLFAGTFDDPAAATTADLPEGLTTGMVYMGGEQLWVDMSYVLEVEDGWLLPDERALRDHLVANGADGWVTVDFDEIADYSFTADAEAIVPLEQEDPSELIVLLQATAAHTDLGTKEVRGQTMAGIGAELTVAEMMAADGIDPVEWLDEALGSDSPLWDNPPPPEVDPDEYVAFMAAVLTATLETVVPMEAWVDSDGRLGQVRMTLDFSTMLEDAAERASEAAPGIVAELRDELETAPAAAPTTVVSEIFDYGDPTIDIQPPDDALDLSGDIDLFDLDEAGAAWDPGQFSPWTPDEHLAYEDLHFDDLDYGGFDYGGFEYDDFNYEDFEFEEFEVDDIEYGEYHNLDDFLAEAEDLSSEADDIRVESEGLMVEADEILAESEALMEDVPAGTG